MRGMYNDHANINESVKEKEDSAERDSAERDAPKKWYARAPEEQVCPAALYGSCIDGMYLYSYM